MQWTGVHFARLGYQGTGALNVELAMVWKTIFCKKAPLPDAEEWGKVTDKLDLLER